jgi:hypothetical protein
MPGRGISAGLSNAITGKITRPAYLIEIAFSNFVRYSTGKLTDWDSKVWLAVKADIALGMGGDHATISFWDHDKTIRTLFLLEGATDRIVRIWQYDDSAIGPVDPTLVFSGVTTGSRIAQGRVNLNLAVAASGVMLCPRERICAAMGFSILVEAGTQIPWGTKILKVERRDA